MNTFYEEYIGFEPILPTEIVDFLNRYKTRDHHPCQNDELANETINFSLDEHELAMTK